MKDQCFLHSYIYNENPRLKTAKLLANAKQLIRKDSVHRANVHIDLTLPPTVRFRLLFKDPSFPLHDERTF